MTDLLRPSVTAPTVFLCTEPVDFRKSIDGLSLLVEQHLGLSPFDSTLYVFTNRKRDKIKILLWEKNGFILWYKRLEKQRFKWPTQKSGGAITLNGQELNWILDGFDLWKNQPHKSLNYRSVG